MIVVEVKLVSAISPDRSRTLGAMVLANDGTGTASKGDYLVSMIRANGDPMKLKGVTRKAKVQGHQRRALPVWVLIRRALQEAGY